MLGRTTLYSSIYHPGFLTSEFRSSILPTTQEKIPISMSSIRSISTSGLLTSLRSGEWLTPEFQQVFVRSNF